jgi:hypothetical protein
MIGQAPVGLLFPFCLLLGRRCLDRDVQVRSLNEFSECIFPVPQRGRASPFADMGHEPVVVLLPDIGNPVDMLPVAMGQELHDPVTPERVLPGIVFPDSAIADVLLLFMKILEDAHCLAFSPGLTVMDKR